MLLKLLFKDTDNMSISLPLGKLSKGLICFNTHSIFTPSIPSIQLRRSSLTRQPNRIHTTIVILERCPQSIEGLFMSYMHVKAILLSERISLEDDKHLQICNL